MANIIRAIKVFNGQSDTTKGNILAIASTDCEYLELGWMNMMTGERVTMDYPSREFLPFLIPGIWYKLDKSKWPIPVEAPNVFVPMTSVIQIAF